MSRKLRTHCLILVILAALCCAGCKPQENSPTAPDTKPAAPVPLADWQKRGAEMAAKINLGMTDDKVETLFGQPTRRRTVVTGGDSMTIWSNQLSGSAFFVIRFGRDSRVLAWTTTSQIPIQ